MILAIVQARIGGTRLPGKVLKKIDGKAVLEYLVEKLRKCPKQNLNYPIWAGMKFQ